MILLVLLVIMLGGTLFICLAWRALGVMERVAAKVGFGNSLPVFGMLSILSPIVGFAAVMAGVYADTLEGVVLALFALLIGPLFGIAFGLAGLFTRERPAVLPVLGMVDSAVFVLFFLFRS